jgi:hypothetical protein
MIIIITTLLFTYNLVTIFFSNNLQQSEIKEATAQLRAFTNAPGSGYWFNSK